MNHIRGIHNLCPYCGHYTNSVSVLGEITPEPKADDFSLCIRCGKFSVFEAVLERDRSPKARLRLRPPNMKEAADISRDPECLANLEAWLAAKERGIIK